MYGTLVRVYLFLFILFVFEDKFCSVQKQLQKYLVSSISLPLSLPSPNLCVLLVGQIYGLKKITLTTKDNV